MVFPSLLPVPARVPKSFGVFLLSLLTYSLSLRTFQFVIHQQNSRDGTFRRISRRFFVTLSVAVLPRCRIFIVTHCFLTSSSLFCEIAKFTPTEIYPFCNFSPLHCKVIHEIFVLIFWYFHFMQVHWFWETVSHPQTFFKLQSLPHFSRFVAPMRAGIPHSGSSSMPSFIYFSL